MKRHGKGGKCLQNQYSEEENYLRPEMLHVKRFCIYICTIIIIFQISHFVIQRT